MRVTVESVSKRRGETWSSTSKKVRDNIDRSSIESSSKFDRDRVREEEVSRQVFSHVSASISQSGENE